MSPKTLYYLFVFVVLVGLADSMYLSMTVLLDVPPICGPLHGCETVAASAYSKLFGVPLAYLGVAYYVFGASIAGFLVTSSRARLLAVWYGVAGALMSIWFVYIQAVLIKALCIYCLVSAAATAALLLITFLWWRQMHEAAN
jgi:uncharacterized membrane protein